jgi:hypothetical protein
MVHSTYILTTQYKQLKKDGFLRLIVFTIVKIMSTDKEISRKKVRTLDFPEVGSFANYQE